jgi:hypothetical protein
MSGRPKLGAVFRGEATPDRTAGLAGLLSVATPVPETQSEDPDAVVAIEPPPEVETTPSEAEAADVAAVPQVVRPVGERVLNLAPAPIETAQDEPTLVPVAPRKPKRVPSKASPAVDRPTEIGEDPESIKMVPANIDLSVHADLRQFATRNELSFATVVLRAIEANAETLSSMWSKPRRPAVKSGLFGSTAAKAGNRRSEPAVQIQLRITVADAQTLNDLVEVWRAPSRGVLITEALRMFVPSAGPN